VNADELAALGLVAFAAVYLLHRFWKQFRLRTKGTESPRLVQVSFGKKGAAGK
jgi:hypothetical protein